jgi:hypothetical protein
MVTEMYARTTIKIKEKTHFCKNIFLIRSMLNQMEPLTKAPFSLEGGGIVWLYGYEKQKPPRKTLRGLSILSPVARFAYYDKKCCIDVT